jgi:NAD(P)H dehydrogenase (quinone)
MFNFEKRHNQMSSHYNYLKYFIIIIIFVLLLDHTLSLFLENLPLKKFFKFDSNKMSKKPLVAILTGNSNSGSACIEELFSRYSEKVNVRGLFRSKEKAQPFAQKYPKLEVITDVDAYQPDTLKTAFKGADSALIVTPHDPAKDLNKAGDDAQLTATMINEAVAAGVKYIVLVASFTVHYQEHMPIIAGRFWPSEDLLEKLAKEKDVKFTVLRGGCFMENLIPGLKKSLKTQEALMMCNMACAMVDTQDIGKSGAACLAANGEGHHGKYYEMTGPEMQNGHDLAKVLTKVFGKNFNFQNGLLN